MSKTEDKEVTIVYAEPTHATISIKAPPVEPKVIRGIINNAEKPYENVPVINRDDSYKMARQSKHINEVSKIASGTAPFIIDGLGNIVYSYGDTKGTITADLADNIELSASTLQLVDMIGYTANINGLNNKHIFISFKAYKEIKGLKNLRRARESMKDFANSLFNVRFNIDSKFYGKEVTFNIVQVTALDKVDYPKSNYIDINELSRKGGLDIILNDFYFTLLKDSKPLPLHVNYFKLDPRYDANSITLYRKMAELKAMNIGKTNENIYSVKTLLGATGIPSKKEVDTSGRQIYQRIIEPFYKALEKLNFVDWHLVHADNTPYSDDDFNPSKNMAGDTITKAGVTYEEFITSKVIAHWKEYPREQELRELKKTRMQKAIKRAENKKINKLTQIIINKQDL